MARVTFINAILSGKLSGTVYARNKAGYYVRNWTKPLDPRTTAQLSNRAYFSSAASAWHSMTEPEKAAWNAYAIAFYVPKSGASPSPYSGFQAFTSLYYTALVCQNRARVNTITIPNGVTATFTNFTPTTTAPVAALSGDIQDSAGHPLPIQIVDATLNSSNANTTVTFSFGSSQANPPLFVDAVTGTPVGFIIQVSNPKTQTQEFTQNPRIRAINYIKSPTIGTGWSASDKIKFEATGTDLDPNKFKEWYLPGQTIEIRAYLVSVDGAQKFLGSIQTTAL